jgi:hemerythrin-like domain-containing protein
MPKDDAAWLPKLKEFRGMIEKHVREEEDDLFPKLREQLSDEQNKHITVAMNKEGLKLA